ncbi:hypothetical protein [Silicimonas sp. MF1-12-2]|jgi:uncharacterized protein YlxW (UPF0749 family)|uniref:hypothetical protein n=1 Tax=Silicimonas sp. MF1-12-2 TaxID=3384793 RepID=UPI0039B6A34D
MGLKKLAAKVVEYNERRDSGKASEIKPSHVKKVLNKLQKKSEELEAEIAEVNSAEKKARLEKKLEVARAHVERAEWLLKELG